MLLALVLALVGGAQYLNGLGGSHRLSDVGYLALQTFVLQLPATGAGASYPWSLDVARFLAPLAVGYTALIAVLALFRDSVDRVRARWMGEHVVVCGLGDRGQEVVRALRAAGRSVVAVDRAPRQPGRSGVARTPIIVGDARERGVLLAAGVARAARVVVVCEDDQVNGEIAAALVDGFGQRRRGTLECQVQVSDVDLVDQLRTREVERAVHDRVLFAFFCLQEVAARRLLVRHPPFRDPFAAAGVVVVGDGPLAAAVVMQTARLWSVLPERPGRLPMRVVAPGASALLHRLRDRYPGLEQACDLDPLDTEPLRGVLGMAAVGAAAGEQRVYVCLDDEAQGLAVAGALVDSVELAGPVVVQAAHERGLTGLAVRLLDGRGRIVPFGATEVACDPDGLFGGIWHELARSIHETYRARRTADQTRRGTGPETVPWAQLRQEYRTANLDQARHIGYKLSAINTAPVPLLSPLASPFCFTDDEVERLAELEHERWNCERRAAGWTLGPKSTQRRTTPYLVPYGELADEIREYDRSAVRAIPSLLAGAGYTIARTPPHRPGRPDRTSPSSVAAG
jgi:hypothetical protein